MTDLNKKPSKPTGSSAQPNATTRQTRPAPSSAPPRPAVSRTVAHTAKPASDSPVRQGQGAKPAASPASVRAASTKPTTVRPVGQKPATNPSARDPAKTPAEVVNTDALVRARQRSEERAAKNKELADRLEAAKREEEKKRALDELPREKKKDLENKVRDKRKKERISERAEGSAKAAAAVAPPLSVGKKKALIAVVAVILAIAITLTIVLVSCNGALPQDTFIVGYSAGNYDGTRPSDNPFVSRDDISAGEYSNEYKNKTKVGYGAEYLGTVARKIPTSTSDEGLVSSGVITAYPTYGRGANYTDEQKRAVINESWQLCTVNTRIGSDGYPKNTYNRMDADGNLYLNDEDTGRDLYKHTAADGMYYGNVSDTEPGIIKKLTYAPRAHGGSYNVTGVYAPAGEVIKVELSEADMNATGGIEVFIGQALYNKKANNIWAARGINRMPVILNTLVLDKNTCSYNAERGIYTGYVGSFYGGPIYVYNENVKFSVTISGAVRYAHYILGYTTPEEYAANLASSAPYFDLEVRENGVLHSGPKASVGAANINLDNIHKCAVLWEKIALISTQRVKQGIVFLYDPFVAAGAAVAFPGQMSVNCPAGWMSGSLNYNSFVTGGAWGNMHEYNHNFQGYGCGSDGEVTNNALNLVEYSLFTKISAARQIGAYGGAGLSGWNCYTSPTWALQRVISGEIGGTNGLAVYATLLHNLGQEAFIRSSFGRNVDYFKNWGNVTHQNMWYYTTLIGNFANEADYLSLLSEQSGYPMFVPVSCVYQTGRSYNYDGQKRYISTAQPFAIKYGEAFTVDLNNYTTNDGMYAGGSIVIPSGFDYRIKKIASPQYGSITSDGNNVFTYHPDANHLSSGKIIVTLEIKYRGGNFEVDDVDLVLEFKQSHEMNKNMLERTTYTYADAENLPATSVEAYESGFAGAEKTSADNINPVQNGNTEIWMTDPMPENTFYEVKGKMYVADSGKYRIALRGRWDCALYVSVNSDKADEYMLAAKIKTDATHANFYLDNAETYYDIDGLTAGDWVYFKAVTKSEVRGGKNGYIGLGWGHFVPPPGVIDENGNLIGPDGNIIENPQETVSVTYANGYRASYESIVEPFESDYFFLRDYQYNYIESTDVSEGQTVVETNYTPWTDGVSEGWYDLSHLFDGKLDTWVHTSRNFQVSADNPLYMTVDMGKNVTATHFDLTCWTEKNMTNIGMPKAFKLEFMDEKNNKVYEKEFTGVSAKNKIISVNLDSSVFFRYYKLTVTATDNGRFAATEMGFSDVFSLPGGVVMEADNEMFVYNGEWTTEYGFYTFGHIYKGNEGASVSFTFNGTYFAVFSYKASGYGSFDVYIDGQKRGTVDLSGEGGASELVYRSEELGAVKHRVELRCVSGTANIDNIVLW